MMHKMRLIHKDIKLDNILYSLSSNNLVLTDFGISHIIS
jgi:serine/threonine protein kinase